MGSTAGDTRDELFALTSAFRQALLRQRRAGVWGAPGAATARPALPDEAPITPHLDVAPVASVLPVVDDLPASVDRSLAVIRAELGDCQRCKLCKTRKNIVF